jgi:hypothetical protein
MGAWRTDSVPPVPAFALTLRSDADPRSRSTATSRWGGSRRRCSTARRYSDCAASSSSAPRTWSIPAPCIRASTTRSARRPYRIASSRRCGARASTSARAGRAVGAGALLHDVTHVPFGHTLEDERRLFARSRQRHALSQLLDGELGARCAELGSVRRSPICSGRGRPPCRPGRARSCRAPSTPICSTTLRRDYLLRRPRA